MEQDIDIFADLDTLPGLADDTQTSGFFSITTSVNDALLDSNISTFLPFTICKKRILPESNMPQKSDILPVIANATGTLSHHNNILPTSDLLTVPDIETEALPDSNDSSVSTFLQISVEATEPLPDSNNISMVTDNNEQIPSSPQTAFREAKRRSARITNQKYNFRNSSIINRIQTEERQLAPKTPKPKTRAQPLSKYRRRTANARERGRMSEINEAFETLAKVIPAYDESSSGSKQTKITTLKLALNYIAALRDTLGYSPEESDAGFSSTSEGCCSPSGASSCDSVSGSLQSPRSNLDSEGEQIVQ